MNWTQDDLQSRVTSGKIKVLRSTNSGTITKPKKRNKYNAKAVTVDGHRFDSQKEADYYGELKLRLKSGDVYWFTVKPLFILPGATHFRPDFQFQENSGTVRVVDVKGIDKQTGEVITKGDGFAVRCRQLREIYGLRVEIV